MLPIWIKDSKNIWHLILDQTVDQIAKSFPGSPVFLYPHQPPIEKTCPSCLSRYKVWTPEQQPAEQPAEPTDPAEPSFHVDTSPWE